MPSSSILISIADGSFGGFTCLLVKKPIADNNMPINVMKMAISLSASKAQKKIEIKSDINPAREILEREALLVLMR